MGLVFSEFVPVDRIQIAKACITMTTRHFRFWSWCVAILLGTGCNAKNESAKLMPDGPNTPEGVYRQFMLAILSPSQDEIRSLIIENPEADVLWQGKYPENVAAALRDQYRSMEIKRATSGEPIDPDKVNLESSAVPIQLNAVKIDGKWKIDAGPLISLRKAVHESK